MILGRRQQRGEIAHVHERSLSESDGVIDGVAELTDVAGPRVATDQGGRGGREAEHTAPCSLRRVRQQLPCELEQVVSTLAERRDTEPDDRQPEQEVLSKLSRRDHLVEVAIGGAEDSRAQLERVIRADALELALLEHAEEFGLAPLGELTDLVQKQRAAPGCLERSDALADGSGEGAALMAEELTFDQRLRDCCAIDHAKGLSRARAGFVNEPCHEGLPDARFPFQQDADVRQRESWNSRRQVLRRR